MGTTGQETHRPGAFKQTNKTHKTGRHRSKGSINSATKGQVSVKNLTKRAKKELGKEARRHQAQQIRQKKREEVILSKRNLGGFLSPPVLITVVPLQENLNAEAVVEIITKADDTAIVSVSPCGVTHVSMPRFKQRFSLVVPPVGNTLATLDAAKVSTTVLFVTSATEATSGSAKAEVIDDWGEEILIACLAQGMPTTIVAITNLENIHIKKRQETKQRAQEIISKWLPEEKIMALDKPTDGLNVLRRAGSQKQRPVAYRNKRPHLLAERIKYTCGSDNFGTLEISGYVRGTPLSVNNLVHIPGMGEYQLSRIDGPEDPWPLDKARSKSDDEVTMAETRILQIADPKQQESLESECVPDPMDAEQTWPTEEEIAQAEAQQKRKIVKRVPKGTSEYQAAWIPDEDADKASEGEDDESEDEEDDMSVEGAKSEDESVVANDEDNEEYESVTVSEAAPDEQRYDQQMDLHEERTAMEKIKEAKLDAQFPDEVDTPQDQLAKTRFQKYRGLESFRTSPWDAKENLPLDYARIFQFQNFERTRRRIFRENSLKPEESQGVMPGWFVTLHVKNVSKELYEAYRTVDDRPLVVFGLLPNEGKMSLVNVVLKRTTNNGEPIKSKERLIFQCGFRRFTACPIFSQHTNGSKHKYERYFQPDSTVVASFYAPITFPPCPVLCYQEHNNGSLDLMATGSILSINPDRIIVKRAVLSGHPFKVHKRSAVVRFMFFNREDIMWFKPVQLRTKYGRRGHIKEPLGTHGHMKCVFDGQLKSQDTILLNLYKRVFPKWTYEPCLLTESSKTETDDVVME